jgi:hypothetical protein
LFKYSNWFLNVKKIRFSSKNREVRNRVTNKFLALIILKIFKKIMCYLVSWPYIFLNNSINIRYRHFRIYIDPIVRGEMWWRHKGNLAHEEWYRRHTDAKKNLIFVYKKCIFHKQSRSQNTSMVWAICLRYRAIWPHFFIF